MSDDLDLLGKLAPLDQQRKLFQADCFSPDDAKYADDCSPLVPYLSMGAEWYGCAAFQALLLNTRVSFGQAKRSEANQVKRALSKVSPANMLLLEKKFGHDQLAVIAEIGRFVPESTKAKLHPGTTSYDVLDTVRSVLYREAWRAQIRPQVARTIETLVQLSEAAHQLQVGRTHLQDTSPVPFGLTLSTYAARLAGRVEGADRAFSSLQGKVSGIVGTGASIDMVIGEGKSMEFEKKVLKRIGLQPDYTATQIVQKERLSDAAHAIATLSDVLGDFSNDMRILYSSAIKEITDKKNAAMLGGSSADATKNNPRDWENIAGKAIIVIGGMTAIYSLVQSDLQRDLRGSVVARYEPTGMMVRTFEQFVRTNKILPQLSVDDARMLANLAGIRNNPSEAMTAILRGAGWTHPTYGVGHDFVKEMGIQARKQKTSLREAAMNDPHFQALYRTLPENQQAIINGEIERYVGSAKERAAQNRDAALRIVQNAPREPSYSLVRTA